ncbi:MAG: hypothetical protein ACI9O4_000012 [Chitinophagales bacterium]|jgi:hypothetical protein
MWAYKLLNFLHEEIVVFLIEKYALFIVSTIIDVVKLFGVHGHGRRACFIIKWFVELSLSGLSGGMTWSRATTKILILNKYNKKILYNSVIQDNPLTILIVYQKKRHPR